uniref:Uncharacterized protein n=1 Tax=Rhizophora mucronata TaxID=61149 RepID=A0A2P2PSN6_RHIMU
MTIMLSSPSGRRRCTGYRNLLQRLT